MLPRKTFDEAEFFEERWNWLESGIAAAIGGLKEDATFNIEHNVKPREWHITGTREGDTLNLDLAPRRKYPFSAAQESRLLDLGWGSYSYSESGPQAFRVMWEPGEAERRRYVEAQRPWWHLWATDPEPLYITGGDSWEAATMILATLKGPLGLLDPDDVALEVPNWRA